MNASNKSIRLISLLRILGLCSGIVGLVLIVLDFWYDITFPKGVLCAVAIVVLTVTEPKVNRSESNHEAN